ASIAIYTLSLHDALPILANVDSIAQELTWQMGRPIRYSPYEITGGLQERARYMISVAERALEDIQAQDKAGFTRFIRREPLGTRSEEHTSELQSRENLVC